MKKRFIEGQPQHIFCLFLNFLSPFLSSTRITETETSPQGQVFKDVLIRSAMLLRRFIENQIKLLRTAASSSSKATQKPLFKITKLFGSGLMRGNALNKKNWKDFFAAEQSKARKGIPTFFYSKIPQNEELNWIPNLFLRKSRPIRFLREREQPRFRNRATKTSTKESKRIGIQNFSIMNKF